MFGSLTHPSLRLAFSEIEPFATETRRHCYGHPDYPDLYVKVVAEADDKRNHTAQMLDLEDHAWPRTCMTEAVFECIPAIICMVDP